MGFKAYMKTKLLTTFCVKKMPILHSKVKYNFSCKISNRIPSKKTIKKSSLRIDRLINLKPFMEYLDTYVSVEKFSISDFA